MKVFQMFFALVVFFVVSFLSALPSFAADINHFDSITSRPVFSNTGTSKSYWVTASTVTTIAANYNRLGGYISNVSTSTIYISLSISTPTAPATAMIDATLTSLPGAGQYATCGESNRWYFRQNDTNLVYRGPVYIYAPSAHLVVGDQVTDVELLP